MQHALEVYPVFPKYMLPEVWLNAMNEELTFRLIWPIHKL